MADQSALAGLRVFRSMTLTRYKSAVNQSKRICWQHYFPLLILASRKGNNEYLISEESGSVCIYWLRQEKAGPRLHLFLMPMPMNVMVLKGCLDRCRDFNSDRRTSIRWVDEEDIGMAAHLEGAKIVQMGSEYLYDPKFYRSPLGAKAKNLRYNLKQIEMRGDVEVRPYALADAADCMTLLDEWWEMQKDKHESLAYQHYTRASLKSASKFDKSDLFGKVILINGKIRSFGFAGKMRAELANMFMGYSDHTIKGLNYFLRYQFMGDLEGCALVNDSKADTPGLQYAKESFCPVRMHGIFRINQSPS